MRTHKPRIMSALMPRTRQNILAATLMRPEQCWYAADLARHLGTSRSSLQRELVHLVAVGILKSWRQGRMVYVQADQDCPVFPELRGLLAKTTGLVDLLHDTLVPFARKIACAFIFGSIASAKETSASDIDLFILGQIGLRELATTIQDLQRHLGRDINPKLYALAEFAKQLGANDHFVLNVLSKPKLFILGSQDVLDDIVKRKPSDA